MLVRLVIVNEMLKCEVPGLLLHRNHHGTERWRGGGSHGRSPLLQNEGIAHHKVVELEDSAYKQGDVTHPDCDCVWLSERVAFVGSPMCSVFGSMVAVLVGKCWCMLAGSLHVPRVHEFKALKKAILGHRREEPRQVLVAQLVCFVVVGCLLNERRELTQLAGAITFPESVGTCLPA